MNRHSLYPILTCAILSVSLAAPTFAAPGAIQYQGRLVDNDGVPVSTAVEMAFSFWSASDGGTLLEDYGDTRTVTPDGDGYYLAFIGGADNPIPPAIFAGLDEVWLNVAINGDDLTPRKPITPAPLALWADQAANASLALTAETAAVATFAHTADMATTATYAVAAETALAADVATTATYAVAAETALAADVTTTATVAHSAETLGALRPEDVYTTGALDTALARKADLVAVLPLLADNYVIVPHGAGPSRRGTEDIDRGAALLAAYGLAKEKKPGPNNRVVVIVPPGRYNLGDRGLVLDTPYIDLVGLTTHRESQFIYGVTSGPGENLSGGDRPGVLMQTADHVRIENLTVSSTRREGRAELASDAPAAYWPDVVLDKEKRGSSANTVIRNCAFLADGSTIVDRHVWAMRVGSSSDPTRIHYAGEYTDVVAAALTPSSSGGGFAFGGFGVASGVFKNCTGDSAFGSGGTASGTFIDCTGGHNSFGGNGVASGRFINCTAGGNSFGGNGGTASGTFTNSVGGARSFGGNGGTASGTFKDCTGEQGAFGGSGVASGTFINCVGGSLSFGGGGTAEGGKFYYCRGRSGSLRDNATVRLLCIRDDEVLPNIP